MTRPHTRPGLAADDEDLWFLPGPTDEEDLPPGAAPSRLYERARDQLVVLAQEAGVDLRQSYARLAPRLALQVGRYAHAKQFKRMRKALKKLKGYTGRVMCDLRRHLNDIPEGGLRDRIVAKLALVSQLLHQQPKGSDKI